MRKCDVSSTIYVENESYANSKNFALKTSTLQASFSSTMGSRRDDVLRLCCEISSEKKIKAAFKGSAKGAAVAAGGAFVGGLMGGPVGIALGATVGGALGGWMTSGQFKPLPEILMELAPVQKDQLFNDVMAVLGTLKWTNLSQLTDQVMGNGSMKEQVFAAILSYTTNQLKADVKYED